MNTLFLLAQAPDTGGAAAAGGFLGGLFSVMAIVWVLGILATVFWLWMLVDVLTSRMESGDKILWFLVVFFLHFVGALIYFFVGRRSAAGPVAGTAT